jgi:peptidoglycan/xylan/chitin deacetylase (PgdA/CDA1 family)
VNDVSKALMSMRDAAQTVQAVIVCRLARMSSARVGVAIVYHRVGGRTDGDPSREILAAVSSAGFEQQLRHLRRHYRVVPAPELLEAVRSRRRGERFPLSITFDDDLSSHVRDASPALQRAGLPATFFLGGTSLREPHPFWWEDLQRAVDDRIVEPDALPHVADTDLRAALERSPKAIFRVAGTIERLPPRERDQTAAALRAAVGPRAADEGLRTDDVGSLVAAGFDVGFHTLRHDALPALSDTALEQALHEGRDAVTAVAGRSLDLISYPYGKADQRVADAARAAGFTAGFTTERSLVTPETDPLLIPRIPPALSAGKTALRLARALASSGSP